MPDLRRVGCHVDVLVRNVLEERRQVDLLLIVAAERGHRLLADDRDYGLVVELGVVQAVEQVDRARARGGDANPDLAGELRVTAGHERRHLLVADLDELRIAAGTVEGAEEGVDPVAGVAVDPVDAPIGQPLEDVVSDQFGHVVTFLSPAPRLPGSCCP